MDDEPGKRIETGEGREAQGEVLLRVTSCDFSAGQLPSLTSEPTLNPFCGWRGAGDSLELGHLGSVGLAVPASLIGSRLGNGV